MLAILYILFFLGCGVYIAECWLPRCERLLRIYLGASFGLLQILWLPALWACALCFGSAAHIAAALTMAVLTLAAWLTREGKTMLPAQRVSTKQRFPLLCAVGVLTVLSAYLQYTHCLYPNTYGGYSSGQSTYGDLSLHLAITTSALNARFPLHNSLMIGESMAYPYLTDTFASTCLLLGLPLNTSMVLTGTLMMLLIFCGYALLCESLCRRKGGALLAFLLLFLNGGLGFFYVLDASVENGVVTGFWEKLQTVMTGYYKTPTNQPEPYNLRWVNLICDMLIPQRGIMGGFTMLMPAFNLLLPPLVRREKPTGKETVLLGLFAGGLPLIHTHSFLALALSSFGFCVYDLCHQKNEERKNAFLFWARYVLIACVLSIPQLLCFTFRQVSSSNHFLRLWFNWCNSQNGGFRLIDGYFWFYLKNIGIPYVLILLALFKRKQKHELELPDDIYQNRMLACGAFLIYLIAELIKFQPNIYDNNKLLYCWFFLCLPMAADTAAELYGRLRGFPGRRVLAGAFVCLCFTSSILTIARECVSSYQIYSAQDIETAAFIRGNTEEGSVFLTGNQHLNPVSSLAGRSIVCSADIYLYFHGFDTTERRSQILRFYQDPNSNLDLLEQYHVQYIYVSDYERSQGAVDENALRSLFPCVYDQGGVLIFSAEEAS